jgi:5'-phosphate synthase pdxT subunit
MTVGVLALQGDFREHCVTLINAGAASVIEVRNLSDFEKIHGLVIPGGESTVIGDLLEKTGIDKKLVESALNGLPVYGTCAGAILLSKKITGKQKAKNLGLLDIEIQRNAYGSQQESFVCDLNVSFESKHEEVVEAFFIRAPKIVAIGNEVEILAEWNGSPVLVKQKSILASTFHPELGNSTAIHKYFLTMIEEFSRMNNK